MVAISVVWIPIMAQAEGGQIFRYMTTVVGYITAPTCCIFVMAMFWGRINEKVSALTFIPYPQGMSLHFHPVWWYKI